MSREFLEQRPKEFDRSRALLESVPALVRIARRAARNDAISHRNVKVGAAIQFYDRENYREARLSGANLKARPEDDKYCAEMDVIDQAVTLGYRSASGLIIAGPSRPSIIQSISDTVPATLHPCSDCRQKIIDHPEIITDDTLIITTSTEENIYQVHMADELRMLYEASETRELMFLDSAAPLRFNDWDEHLNLYDQLKSQNPGTSTQLLAKIALENIVEVPDI